MGTAARLLFSSQLSAARAVVLFAAMVGLFAMHGLADHGATHGGDHATVDAALPLAAHGQPHEPVATAAQVSSVVGETAAEDLMGSDDGHPPADMGLMGLCLAVIAMVALLVATSMHTRGRARDPLRTLLRQLAVPPAMRAGPDPPDRYRLQVHRC